MLSILKCKTFKNFIFCNDVPVIPPLLLETIYALVSFVSLEAKSFSL